MNCFDDSYYKKKLESIKDPMDYFLRSFKENNDENFIINNKDILGEISFSNTLSSPKNEEFITSLSDRRATQIESEFKLLLQKVSSYNNTDTLSEEEEKKMMSWPEWCIDGKFSMELFQGCHALFFDQLIVLTPPVIQYVRSIEYLQDDGKFNVQLFQYMCETYRKKINSDRPQNTSQTLQEKMSQIPESTKYWPEWKINGEFNQRLFEYVYRFSLASKKEITQDYVNFLINQACFSVNGHFDLDNFCQYIEYYCKNPEKAERSMRLYSQEDDDITLWSEWKIDGEFNQEFFENTLSLLSILQYPLQRSYVAHFYTMDLLNRRGEFDLDLFCRWSKTCQENINQISSWEDLTKILSKLSDESDKNDESQPIDLSNVD